MSQIYEDKKVVEKRIFTVMIIEKDLGNQFLQGLFERLVLQNLTLYCQNLTKRKSETKEKSTPDL